MQPDQKLPHPLSGDLLRWAVHQPFSKDVPEELRTKLLCLSVDEQHQCISDMCGYCFALVRSSRLRSAHAALNGARKIQAELALQTDSLVSFTFAELSVAHATGNLDTVLELLPRLANATSSDLTAGLYLYQDIRNLREQLTDRIGRRHAECLAVLLQPIVDRSIVTEILEREAWVSSSDCRSLLLELSQQVSPPLQDECRRLMALLDAGSKSARKPNLETGRQWVTKLTAYAKPALSAGDAEGMFLAADRLELPEMPMKDAGAIISALHEQERHSVHGVLPVWLLWRGARRSRWPDEILAYMAVDVMDLMRPASGEYAVQKRRKELAEFALNHAAEDESTIWQARLHYALMHICVRLSEFEGDTAELIQRQYLSGKTAMMLFLRIGDEETAAQCIDLLLLARIRMPAENGGGLKQTLAYIDELLSRDRNDADSKGPPAVIRAALLTCRHRFCRDSDTYGADYAQRKADLEEAFELFSSAGGEHKPENLVRVCMYLSNLEFKHFRHGHPQSLDSARCWSERGLEIVDDERDPEGFSMLVMAHVQILLQQKDYAAARSWIQRALSLPSITSTFRASLLVERARVRLQEADRTVQGLQTGLQELDEAIRLLGPAQNEELRWSIIRVQSELHSELGDHPSSVRALRKGLRAWQQILSPVHRADLRAELIPHLLRQREDGPADEEDAAHELDGLLVDAQTVPWDGLRRICDAVWDWLYYHCLHRDNLLYKEERATELTTLAKTAQHHILLLLIEIWRGRATGTPSLPELFDRIEEQIVEQPQNKEALLGLGLYLALHECEDDHSIVNHWSNRLEVLLLAQSKERASTGSVDFLVKLANLRLDRRIEGPNLLDSQAARRLIEKAAEIYPEERLSPMLRARLVKVRLLAKLRCMGLTPGQDPHKLSIDAQLLAREAAEVLEPGDHLGFLEELHHRLVNYAAPDASPLRTYAAELRRNYGVGDFDAERVETLDSLTRFSKSDNRELQTLREIGMPKDLAKALLHGEHLAQLSRASTTFTDQGLAVLMPLLSQATAAVNAPWRALFTARVHRALGWLWMRHKSQDLRRTIGEAIRHFECSSALWPTSDPDGFLDIAEEYANALWRFETDKAEERKAYSDRANQIIHGSLAHPRAGDFPARQARLYRLLGLVEQHRERFLSLRDDASIERMLGYHEKALALCPPSDVDSHFQILLTLANACRDVFQAERSRERNQALLDRAIGLYREALSMSAQLKLSPPTEPARAKKCLADALRFRAQVGDLDEAKALILESLQVRTEERFPIPRAESLLSLAELELVRHEQGFADALQAARQAAVDCQTILAHGASPAVEQSVAALLRRIGHLSENQASDANGRGRPGPPVMQSFLDEIMAEQRHLPPLDPRIHNRGVFEGNMAKSLLFSIMSRHVSASLQLLSQFPDLEPNALYVPLPMALERIEKAMASGDVDQARRFLEGVFSVLCGNSQDFSGSDHGRLFHAAEQLLDDAFLAEQPWDSATMWRHQAVHTMGCLWSHLTTNHWEWLERQERAALSALETRSSDDPYLPEFWKTLALILWKRPYGAFRSRHREALALYDKALRLARHYQQSSMVVSLLNDLATLLHELSREDPALLQQSVAYYTEIVEKTEPEGRDLDHHQMALGNRAWARIELSREHQPQALRDAVEDLEQALKLCGDSPFFLRNCAHHLLHLGLAHTELMSYESGHERLAVDALERCIEIAQQLKDPVEEARGLHNLGLLFLRTGQPTALMQAKEVLEVALAKRRGRTIEEWETLGTLVAVRMRAFVPFGVLPDDRRLFSQVEALLSELIKQQLPERALTTHRYLFDLARRRREPHLRELIQRAEQAIRFAEDSWASSVRSVTQHLFSQQIAFWAAWRTLLAVDEEVSVLEVLRHSQQGKARTLRWRRALMLDLPAAHRDAYSSHLSKLQQLSGSTRPEDQAAALRLEDELLQKLRETSTQLESNLPEINRDTLLNRLRLAPQSAIIDLSVTEVGSVCVRAYLRRDGELILESKRLSLTSHDIDRALNSDEQTDRLGWHAALERVGDALIRKGISDTELLESIEPGHATCMRMLAWLHTDVMAPLVSDLQAQGIVDLVLCLPGVLAQLPIAAAYRMGNENTPRHLIEDFRSIALVPAVTTFLEGQRPARSLRRAAIVVTESSVPSEAIQSTNQVTERLRRRGVSIRQLRESASGRERATVSSAIEVIGEFDLVHFVCHGRFNGSETGDAGLILGQRDVLSVSRLLGQPSSSPAELAVLAACRSGQTTAQDFGGEWLGFSGALLRIGVRNVVAALWDVETRSTMRILDNFYEAHLERQETPAISLGSAMREQLRLGRLGESGGVHPLIERAAERIQQRLRRLCASPLWWAGLVVMKGI